MTLTELAVKVSIKGAEQVKRSVQEVRDAMHGAAKAAGDLAQKAKPVGEALANIGRVAVQAATGIGLTSTAVFALAAAAGFESAKNLDSLTRGLASVSVNAEDLRGQLSRLREVAKLPGLGFAEAVQGSLALQSAGLSADLAERSLAAFGNALATVGKGKADLDGVTLALSQIASKGKVSAEEINQINERVPQIRAAMQAAFGTADGQELDKMGVDTTTFINGVVSQLERLPKVTGGIGNAIENLQDRLQQALLPLGKGLVAMFEGAAPSIEKLLGKIEERLTAVGEVFQAIGKSGVLADVFERLLGLTGEFSKGDFQKGLIETFSTLLSVIGGIPQALSETGTYISDLFSTIGANVTAIGEYLGKRLGAIWKSFSEFAMTSMGWLSAMFNAMGALVATVAPQIAKLLADAGAGLAGLAKQANAAIPGSDIPGPQLKALPSLPNYGDILFGRKDAYGNAINGAMGPLSDIPDGLNYGGEKSPPGQKTAVESSLKNIEANTKATADALSLRRQTTGGGELGNLGVTPAELFGGNPSGRSGYSFGGSTGDPFAQVADILRQAVEQKSQAMLARASGSGMAFKPRN